MTPERLRELIAAGESLDIEFKGEESRPLSDGELVDAVGGATAAAERTVAVECAGAVAGACAVGCDAGAPPIGCRKSSVTQMMPFLSTVTPTPTWVKSWSRMFARCSGLFMNAVWMSETVGPSPTFSPTACQFLTSVVRPGLWYSDCCEAIRCEWPRATAVRS